ncbi:PDZ-binding protein [Vararia minispora EC-137]|uniref:PDZ-binding protein n=1 Tax=Vararia minispora EC-137 TaxID=1314806 RepID=A0ACB8QQH3_9AGAM|nr:PDZ-binding protein [Vararia minispora EC-137]
MVCAKCEKKLSKLAAPDPFQSSSTSIKEGSRKVGENKLLTRPGGSSGSKNRYSPYGSGKCKDCKQPVTQNKAKYCHGCAFKKGICSICGKQILDTKGYAMVNK